MSGGRCMVRLLATLVGAAWTAGVLGAQAPPSPAGHFGLGRPPEAEEVRALDIDVRPDGQGLPPGRGTVAGGRELFAARCAACHGVSGEGLSADRLVGRTDGESFAFATNTALPRTIGSYWPYATTLFDYTRRAMPQPEPGSLTADQTYGLVAYLLFLNGIIAEDVVMDAVSLPRVVMPARDRFVVDDRAGGPEVR